MMKLAQPTFTIQEVSLRLGLPKSTLRFWEKEFDGCIRPRRTSGGQRRYCVQDLEVFEMINDLKQQGLTLSDIKREMSLKRFSEQRLDPTTVDQLANRIAGAVRQEVINFFRQGNS